MLDALSASPAKKWRENIDMTNETPSGVTSRQSGAKYFERACGPVMISYEGKYVTPPWLLSTSSAAARSALLLATVETRT